MMEWRIILDNFPSPLRGFHTPHAVPLSVMYQMYTSTIDLVQSRLPEWLRPFHLRHDVDTRDEYPELSTPRALHLRDFDRS